MAVDDSVVISCNWFDLPNPSTKQSLVLHCISS